MPVSPPFQALSMTLAGRVGTGNIAGVATAITSAARAPCSGCGWSPASSAFVESTWASSGKPVNIAAVRLFYIERAWA